MKKKLVLTNLSRRYKDDALKSKVKQSLQVETPDKPLSYFQLFKYSTQWEKIQIATGFILICLSSIGYPTVATIYGEFTTLLIDRAVVNGTSTSTTFIALFGGGRVLTNDTDENNSLALVEDARALGLSFSIIAVISFILLASGIDLINYAALHQIARIRKRFLEALLRQDMTWFDTTTNVDFATKITDDLNKIREGIGEKFGMFIYLIMTFIISIIYSFAYGWKLTLVVITCVPFIVLSTALVTKMQTSLSEKELKSYSVAGSVAEEVLGGIRTVVAFGGEQKEVDRYRERLRPAENNGERKGIYTGIGGGLMWFVIYCCYALAFWYGIGLIIEDRTNIQKTYTPAVLIIVLCAVLSGAQNLGFTSPLLEAFSTAHAAGASVFSIIDRKSLIDPMNTNGLKLAKINGDIEFENIKFQYPSRNDTEILCGLNLSVKAGQTVALVGPSGCGKSTCIQLLQRLYDPQEGCVRLDGIKINELNTAWLRSNIGVVGQEPALFATTIGENIKYGNPTATQEEIEKAAMSANCHNFIIKLPNGYDTMVGERGTQISGGQKQRIAIARALVRDPKILLLDEATSALDPTSERKVQKALEKASEGRTTIVVSHRLSTITNSDKIVFIQDGIVKEEGNHEELMNKMGLYYNLVKATSASNENLETQTLGATKLSRNISILSYESAELTTPNNQKDNEEDTTDDQDQYQVSVWRLIKMNAPEWRFILVGCLAAIIQGSSLPIFAVLFGEFYGILSLTDSDEVIRRSNTFSIFFVLLGLFALIATFLQTYMLSLASVRLTSRLREMSFKTMLSQEMEWFDHIKNSTGQLCARLSGDCGSVQGAAGSRIGTILQSISTLAIGAFVSLYFSWQLTLVSLVIVPFLLGCFIWESRYSAKSGISEKKAIESASNIAVEAIANIRTIASLGQETYVLKRFSMEMDKAKVACRNNTRLRGSAFALGHLCPVLAYGLAFYYGGLLVSKKQLHYKNMIKASEALLYGGWMLGHALAYAPSVNAAMVAAGRVFKLLDRVPRMYDVSSQLSQEMLHRKCSAKTDGNIVYRDVTFRYPTRPQIPVLQGLNLEIPKGSTVALVGPSGCGKTTCMQLLLRYYDPDAGQINLDGTATTDFTMDTLRSQLGLVSQEPILFDRTIAENIAYGDNSRDVLMPEIIEAAKKANIHEFVSSLTTGYETRLGNKGAQLSGGQKQRIAIARALVRNPRILLLDEATSALDTHSEKFVQQALDAARAGRTCITIAHRLTTVQNADLICVIQNGVIVEKGTHQELLQLGKIYAKLYSMQKVT